MIGARKRPLLQLALNFWPAVVFLHKEIPEDIVVFAEEKSSASTICTRKRTGFHVINMYGENIISLIRPFFFPASLQSTRAKFQTRKNPIIIYSSIENWVCVAMVEIIANKSMINGYPILSARAR